MADNHGASKMNKQVANRSLNPGQVKQRETRGLCGLLLAGTCLLVAIYAAFANILLGLAIGSASLILGWLALRSLAVLPDLLRGSNESF